jgi:oligopeptide transport system permease protein
VKYIIRRVLFLIPILIGVSFMTFGLLHVIPGGPFDVTGLQTQQAKQELEAIYHLDRPFMVQYLLYLKGVVHGDLGTSYRLRGVKVSSIIAQRFNVSWRLGLAGLFVVIVVGVPAGVIAAVRHNKWPDYTVMFGATVGYSIPNFVVSLLLLLVFSVSLRLLPVGGWGTPQNIILPAIALGLPWASAMARFTRASMLEALTQDYVRTARAKGLASRSVLTQHALRNAAIPLLTVLGAVAGELLTGSVAVEKIFGIPGIGQYMVIAIETADYPMVMGLVLFYAFLIVIINLIVDITYTVVDPRIKY